ncbi:MAG: isopeptide-forming domain-containing fimbrial protein [Lachnospiraceae bacterium]|nr:isopeptide-forming domain-containing fimbrial protein [Lachnospiraceae bacterium]
MKTMKKFICLLLAAVLAIGMSMTVLAAELGDEQEKEPTPQEYSITVPGEPGGHTYEIYQIFTGDVDVNKVLSNIKWGKNGTGTEGEAVSANVLQELEDVASETEKTDKEQLAVIKKYVNLDGYPYATIGSGEVLKGVPAGYYLIKDKDGSLEGKEDESYTLNIVQIVGPVEIRIKAEKPTVDKKVSTNNTDGWGDTADHAINEQFQFKLTATVPAGDDIAAYDSYELVFNDTMSAGVTFENIVSVKAYVGNSNGGIDIAYDTADIQENAVGATWSLTIVDLKKEVGDDFGNEPIKVEVIYNVHLNENAIVHNSNASVSDETGNYNKVELEYSNNPNSKGKGKTKPDYAWVFSFKVDNNKVDGDNKPLPGAGFKLYRDEACTEEVKLKYDNDQQAYIPVKENEEGEEMFSSNDGKAIFNIKGLKQGTYYLKETTTPEGYNTCDVIKIDIVADHSENKEGNGADLTLTANDGKAATDTEDEVLDSMSNHLNNTVINHKGSTLPETGGIGTTIFYVLGGILVLGCGVILVTRKRMSK